MTHPLAGRKQTPEHIAKRAAANRGRKQSAETKAKISAAKKGHKAGMTGKQHSEEAKAKMRESHLGQPSGFAGKTHTPEARTKISAALKGRPSHRLGATQTAEARAKISAAKKGVALGARQANWKGDDVGYVSLHKWVSRYKPKTGVCVDCGGQRRTQWSNVDHRYRRVLEDFVERCASCHKLHDRGMA